MFFLVTGASGVGKTSARLALKRDLEDLDIVGVEFCDVVEIPSEFEPDWRVRSVEKVVQFALEHQRAGRHVMMAGDPVPPGELLAVPSADQLDGIAVCLLHCEPEVQMERLRARREPEELLHRHVAFNDWMLRHASDPTHMPEVITQAGWDAMEWERWMTLEPGDPRWQFVTLDTTERTRDEVATQIADWCRAALLDEPAVPVFRPGWWE